MVVWKGQAYQVEGLWRTGNTLIKDLLALIKQHHMTASRRF